MRRDVAEQVAQVARDRAAGPSRLLRASALVLAALSLTMTSAHVLEMPQKMRLSPALYSEINGTLYRWFASVGGAYTVLAIGAAWLLALSARKTRAVFAKASIAAMLMSAALVSWLVVVLPVNRSVASVLSRRPADLPATWALLRPRWEYGHVLGFVLSLAGFCVLAIAVVGDASNTRQREVSD
jgi:hypothetical protein